MRAEFRERMRQTWRRTRPVLTGLVGLGVAAALLGEGVKTWQDNSPISCIQPDKYGVGRIDLSRRVSKGEGVQNIELGSNFFIGDNQAGFVNSDPNCPPTRWQMTYSLDFQIMTFSFALDMNRADLAHSRFISFAPNIPRYRPHAVSVAWSESRIIGAAVDGNPIPSTNFRFLN